MPTLVGYCHDRDRTYPYMPYPDLSTPFPSHLNHSRAPNTKPEPSDPLASQQRTPKHSDSLASNQRTPKHSDPLASNQRTPNPTLIRPFPFLTSSQFPTPTLIPDPMHPRPLLFLASSQFPTNTLIPDPTSFNLHSFASKSIPDISSVSRLRSGKARSRTSLARCVLVRPFSLPIYMFPLCSSVTSLATLRSFSMSHPQFPISVYPCFIYLYSLPPSTLFSYSIHFLRPIPDRSDQPDPYHTHTCINTLVTRCCSSV